MSHRKLVAIGASAGGIFAVQRLLGLLPRTFELPIVVVQHLPRTLEIDLSLVYGGCGRALAEAVDKTPLESSGVYFAPPGYHLLVERDLTLSLSQDDPVHHACPSIDVTFESIALNLGTAACGVLLTGANSDGALGLKEISREGGATLVQDPAEAEARMMPAAALECFRPDFVGTIDEIAVRLTQLNGVPS